MILALAEAARNIRTAAADKNQKETMMLELDQKGDNDVRTGSN